MERTEKEKKMKAIHAAICIVNQMLEFLPDDYKDDKETYLPISVLEDYQNMLIQINIKNYGRKRNHAHTLS